MFDLRLLRQDLDAIRERLGHRGSDVPWEELRSKIKERHALTPKLDDLRHQLKKGSEAVAQLKRNKQPAEAAIAEMKELGDQIKQQEEEMRVTDEQVTNMALNIPNLPHSSVPAGKRCAGQ